MTKLTPNLNRLAEMGTVFDNHWCGSAPCMPARRDLFTGRLNFLERNWGGAEPFDHLLPKVLKDERGVYSHLVTDHSFYVTQGGENFHSAFSSWDIIRGQEHDPLVPLVDKPSVPPHHGLLSPQYHANRATFHKEADYPVAKTFSSAVDWLELNHKADNYFLMVESFDPHEPFDTPKEYLDLYNDKYEGIEYFWPHYAPCDDDAAQNEHIHNCYYATLTMMDRQLGRLFAKMDQYHLWEDTCLLFTTDHGFMLGEHGFMAKNYMPAYNEVFHIPLVAYHPAVKGGGRCNALTQITDIFPTILDLFGVDKSVLKNPIHGKSIVPLLTGEREKTRDAVLYGYFGLSMNITDGEHTYFRAAKDEANQPLYMYTATMATLREHLGHDTMTRDAIDKIQSGRFLPWTNYPVMKINGADIDYKNDSQAFTKRSKYNSESLLFNIQKDYAQSKPIADSTLEARYITLLRQTLAAHDCPSEQYLRLGI